MKEIPPEKQDAIRQWLKDNPDEPVQIAVLGRYLGITANSREIANALKVIVIKCEPTRKILTRTESRIMSANARHKSFVEKIASAEEPKLSVSELARRARVSRSSVHKYRKEQTGN